MTDETPKKKPLSEIGHLFLSSVREQTRDGAPRPTRIPPRGLPAQVAPKSEMSFELTPEEYAEVLSESSSETSASPERRTPPVTAIIGEHLNGKQLARAKDYARHLAAMTGRVGLIVLDGSEFRLVCFEPGDQPAGPIAEQTTDCYDPRAMAEAIEEMNFDVERWLLLIPTPRVPEAQSLLKSVDHWVLLSTCDHDGVVSSYRMLKALMDVHKPRLSLAVIDAIDVGQADRIYKKLSGVCRQFLDLPLESEPAVRRENKVCEHPVMLCRPTRDKAQLANPPQWDIVAEFIAKARPATPVVVGEIVPRGTISGEPSQRELVADVVMSSQTESAVIESTTKHSAGPAVTHSTLADLTVPLETAKPTFESEPQGQRQTAVTHSQEVGEVLELPTCDASADQIVNAILRQDNSTMLECPVRPPMCLDARLAVTRDRGVVLLAVAKRGLADLSTIGNAYRWLLENRALIGMAVPQLSIDSSQTPRLRLLVDQMDAAAEVLQPMLTGDHVAVQSYRRVKWGSKAGLLLDAA
jgi:hypothetical protein